MRSNVNKIGRKKYRDAFPLNALRFFGLRLVF